MNDRNIGTKQTNEGKQIVVYWKTLFKHTRSALGCPCPKTRECGLKWFFFFLLTLGYMKMKSSPK
jgi:hypothetical protein